ncbi:hypothetical protein WA158_000814 [Blastocystis sp. Blastoise]
MSGSENLKTEDKFLDLFTFQDETKLWIPKEFIEKYQQFPFYDIIEHSDKYEDGSYYVDMLPFHIEKVISFLIDKNMDISSLNLRDSYDIYKTFVEYPVTIDNEFQSDLLFHVKELFINYLKENDYCVCNCSDDSLLNIPMILLNSNMKRILIKGLFTPQRKEEFLYYSLLYKMMNITKVEITYDYASNIPLEYICPSSIQDIFPSLEELKMTVTTHYKQTELLLNPNSDEYIMEYSHLLNDDENRINKRKKYEYYTESEMNEYNKISSLDLNKLYYSHKLIDSYSEKKEKNELPNLYKYIVKEAIYTNDYSKVEINETEDEYTLDDQVRIEYDDKTNNKTFSIHNISSEIGISQLLLLPSYICISQVILNEDRCFQCNSVIFMKLFEEGFFDSLTTLNIYMLKEITNEIDDNLLNKIMTTHVFPNVTELIYNDDDSFQLSSIKKECFPKLHIINYQTEITTDNSWTMFLANITSMIDTIRINEFDDEEKEEIVHYLNDLAYNHSIHIDISDIYTIDSSHSDTIEVLQSIENNNLNIDWLEITFKVYDDYDENSDHYNNSDDDSDYDDRDNSNSNVIYIKRTLERFLKSNILEHLNSLTISFDDDISIEYITWISTLFNENKFNTIRLTIDLKYINKNLSSEYLTAYENIFEKLIPKAYFVKIEGCTMNLINRLIPKGCFHNTTQLVLDINDIPDDNFCKLYTTHNFPKLKSINIYKFGSTWWSSFIKIFCNYVNSDNYPLSSIIQLTESFSLINYIYDPNNSILRCKYDTNSLINTIIGSKDETMNKYEMETLFDYIYDEEQLSTLINFITTGKFPKLKELGFWLHCNTYEQRDIYKQKLSDSSFIKENHVSYEFNGFL